MRDLRAISLYQPWATLVMLGAKTIETRSWPTSRRGLLAIHATKASPPEGDLLLGREPFASVLARHRIRALSDLPRGAIIAVARLVDCRSTGAYDRPSAEWVGRLSEQERAFGDFTWGRYGWWLEDVQALADPIPCRGSQGLWPVPADIAAEVIRRTNGGAALLEAGR